MKSSATAAYLQQCFPAYDFDWSWLHEHLHLDLAHIQLIRDYQAEWPESNGYLLLTVLFLVDAVNHGSLCLPLDDHRLHVQSKRYQLTQLKAHIEALETSHLEFANTRILVVDHGCMYFDKHHSAQQALEHEVASLVNDSKVPEFEMQAIKRHIEAVFEALPYQLESQQIQGLLTALIQPFSIISGGPGTGKTTILLSLLQVLSRLGVSGDQVALAAPTGRAANRMTESIQQGLATLEHRPSATDVQLAAIEATTIHRLIGANPMRGGNRYHANNWLPYAVVVVDEVSMVDLLLMNQLMQAIGPSTRLIFLGDQFQLPAVQSGALLADLMPPVGHVALHSEPFIAQLKSIWPSVAEPLPALVSCANTQLLTDKVTLLKVSKRCEPQIASLSELVRQGDAEAVVTKIRLFLPKQDDFSTNDSAFGAHWIHAAEAMTIWPELVQSWFTHHFLKCPEPGENYVQLLHDIKNSLDLDQKTLANGLSKIFSIIKSQRVLTLTHGGPTGTEQINQQVSGWLKSTLKVNGSVDCFHGAVIMVMHNDPMMGLYNGDVGLVIEVANNQFQVFFEINGQFSSFSVHLIPGFKLAFAMTVHKSQGSEFGHVLLPLTDQLESPMLSREIIYTGMTRAKQTVYIFGTKAALKKAINNKSIRYSGLTFWYNDE